MPNTHSPTVQNGDLLENLAVLDLNISGGGVARYNGMVVFLNAGLPGETVNATVTSVQKNILKAELLEIIEPSKDRTLPRCKHFNTCGGCTWQNLTVQAQEQWKSKHVQETLRRIGKVADTKFAGLMSSPAQFNFRNKMTFAFGKNAEGQTALGLRMRDSHDIVEIEECHIFKEQGIEVIKATREFLEKNPLPVWEKGEGFLRFLTIRIPDYQVDAPSCIAEFITAKDKSANKEYSTAVKLLSQHLLDAGLATGFAHTEKKAPDMLAQGERLIFKSGEITCHEKIGKLILEVPCDSFVQTNPPAAALLYEQVAAMLNAGQDDVVWDIYCGVGGLGLYVAENIQKLHGFDWQPGSTMAAKNNARTLGVLEKSHFKYGDLNKSLKGEKSNPDIIIVDPPRAGIDSDILNLIRESTAKKLIYVSCDVATQARDISRLGQEWVIEKSIAVDMFPQTPHVESVVMLKKVI